MQSRVNRLSKVNLTQEEVRTSASDLLCNIYFCVDMFVKLFKNMLSFNQSRIKSLSSNLLWCLCLYFTKWLSLVGKIVDCDESNKSHSGRIFLWYNTILFIISNKEILFVKVLFCHLILVYFNMVSLELFWNT